MGGKEGTYFTHSILVLIRPAFVSLGGMIPDWKLPHESLPGEEETEEYNGILCPNVNNMRSKKIKKNDRSNKYRIPEYWPTRSNNVIGPDTKIWFGKHIGLKASQVPKSYWVWARKNLTGLAISPEL